MATHSLTSGLEIVLGAGHTTNPLRWIAIYRSPSGDEIPVVGSSEGTTAVTILDADIGIESLISLVVHNADTVNQTVTIRNNVNSVSYPRAKATLSTLETLYLSGDGEWYVVTSTGERKTSGSGGGGTDADAIHDNVAGEIAGIAEKVSPVGADLIVIEDSADSNNKKRVQIMNLPGGADADAIHDNVAGEIVAIAEKTAPVANDEIVAEDSEAANAKASIKLSNVAKALDVNDLGTKQFHDDTLEIRNPGDTFSYTVRGGAIVADRDITLPVLTGNDTFVFESHTQTLTNKTLTSPTIVSSDQIQDENGNELLEFAAVASAVNHLRATNSATGNGAELSARGSDTDVDLILQPKGAGLVHIEAKGIDPASLAQGDLLKDNGTDLVRFAKGTEGQVIVVNSGATDLEYQDRIVNIPFSFDQGSGTVLTTGVKGWIVVDNDLEVTGWSLIAEPDGALVIDVNRSTWAGYPTTSSIAGTELPTITATNDQGQDYAITSWSDINAGDVIEFEIDSVTTCERFSLSLRCRVKG